MNEIKRKQKIYGKAHRMNNQHPEKFGEKWGDFLKNIPQYTGVIYAVYTNYDNDYTGDFDFILGMEDRMDGEEFILPEGKYYVWDTGSEDPKDVGAAWQKIWNSDIRRTYYWDYEVYAPNETIKIYLSIK